MKAWLSFLFKIGLRVAPGVSKALAWRLFCTPVGKHPLQTEKQLELRDRATVEQLLFEGKKLSVYRWKSDTQHTPNRRLLFVHGWAGHAFQFGEMIAHFSARGFECIAIDLPAHGRSSGKVTTLPEAANAIINVGQHYGPFDTMVCHSFGGLAGGLSLSKHPILQGQLTINHLILIAVPFKVSYLADRFGKILSLDRAYNEAFYDRIHLISGQSAALLSLGEFLTQKVIHTLLIHDKQDKAVPFSDAKELIKAVPYIQTYFPEGLGHNKMLENDTIIDKIEGFIS